MCGSAPKAPDPVKTANAQAAMNSQAAIEGAKLSAIDQYGPFGSTIYQRRPDGTPISQTVNLSPDMQSWLDAQFGASTKLQNATSQQLGFLPTDRFALPNDVSADSYARGAFGDQILDPSRFTDTGDIAKASYESAKAMYQPDMDEQRKQTEISLANRGINPGDEIWEREMGRLDRQQNMANEQASRSATLDAGNEQTRRQNAAIGALNFGQNTYQTTLGNRLLERTQPFNEASALMGGTPQFQSPSFMNTGQVNVAAPDYQSAVNTKYQADMANYNNRMSGIAGLVGTGIKAAGMFSDENMKENRSTADGEAILAAFRGMPVDDYAYKDEARAAFDLPEERTGPMAQDWAEAFGGDGQTIDIGDYLGNMMAAIKALDARTASLGGA